MATIAVAQPTKRTAFALTSNIKKSWILMILILLIRFWCSGEEDPICEGCFCHDPKLLKANDGYFPNKEGTIAVAKY